MDRTKIINTIGIEYHTPNIENGEYSYVQEAGSKAKLEQIVGHTIEHFKLDIRFESDDVVILVETKPIYSKEDEDQLKEYLEEEKALHNNKKIICILANTKNDNIKVWKSAINESSVLSNETIIDSMEHYIKLFYPNKHNDKEEVMTNTYKLNELLHKMDIDANKRSQFVGTTLLYIKDKVKQSGFNKIDDELKNKLNDFWKFSSAEEIRTAIKNTLDALLDGSENKQKKIELLQKNVLNDQKIKRLSLENWIEILDYILMKIYKYIDDDSAEGQDILNLFFIAFNKYIGKADKNQAFTPDHITEFMCQIAEVDKTKVVLDATCGSGSFLVQAMVKELADCRKGATEEEAKTMMKIVKEKHIFGIENEEKVYGLATTNMLIHTDGNSNIKFGDCFNCEDFIKKANPDIILMNPPYNAKPKDIPDKYKTTWTQKAKNGKAEPTKGFVFIHFLSDVIEKINKERELNGKSRKLVKLAVLLPVSAAIGSSEVIKYEKIEMLKNNTLDAVFTLPTEIFYPGASASACCMVFTLGKPHSAKVTNQEGQEVDMPRKETFFGYYKEDGFKKKKGIGRIEQFDNNRNSIWKAIEKRWLDMYHNRQVIDGLSALAKVNGESEWLCEAYMKTDYKDLKEIYFHKTINRYLAYLMQEGMLNYNLKYKPSNTKPLKIDTWKPFKIPSLFKVKAGIYYYPEEYEDGTTPYVSASDMNNGIPQRININPDFDANTITIGKIGATTYYQPEKYCATSDVNVLTPRFPMNKYIGLFITQVINYSENYKWSYGRQCRVGDSEGIIIKLPIKFEDEESNKPYIDPKCEYSEDGYVPNWQFMEEYIKSLPYGSRI